MGTDDDAGYIRIPTRVLFLLSALLLWLALAFTPPSDQHPISSNSRHLKTICQKFGRAQNALQRARRI